jgi:hypothetical protein
VGAKLAGLGRREGEFREMIVRSEGIGIDKLVDELMS